MTNNQLTNSGKRGGFNKNEGEGDRREELWKRGIKGGGRERQGQVVSVGADPGDKVPTSPCDWPAPLGRNSRLSQTTGWGGCG